MGFSLQQYSSGALKDKSFMVDMMVRQQPQIICYIKNVQFICFITICMKSIKNIDNTNILYIIITKKYVYYQQKRRGLR